MERASNVNTILSEFNWSDLGTWGSVYEESTPDKEGNVVNGDVMTYDVSNSLLRSDEGKLMVVQGLDNYIVVNNKNVLMICAKDQEQKVKEFVNDVSQQRGGDFV